MSELIEMDLPTHAAFGLAVGLVFFGQPSAAVLVLIGAILPDLDRDWLVKTNAVGEDQRHRAILHNVFIVALAFLLSPFLAVGVFLHMLQDSFTTANDKGCEWFYPVSRWVKRGKFNEHKEPVLPLDPKERIYFLQEDPENVDSGPAIPWRRVYGPAQNSNIVDRLFLVSSLIVAGVWFGLKASVDLPSLVSAVVKTGSNWVLFLALAVVLLAGFFCRNMIRSKLTRVARAGIVLLGLTLTLLWGFLVQTDLSANIKLIGSSWIPILLSGFLIVLSSYVVVEWHARKYKPAAVV
jgi:hypothetical protein